MTDQPHLCHSVYGMRCQIARLALSEKGAAYRSTLVRAVVQAGAGEIEEPPVLRLGDQSFVGALDIMTAVDTRLPGPSIRPRDESERYVMHEWLAPLGSIRDRELELGLPGGLGGWRRRGALARRLRSLRARATRPFEAHDANGRLISRLSERLGRARDRDQLQEDLRTLERLLDQLNGHFAGRRFIAGDAWSMADAVWTAVLARLKLLGLDELAGDRRRPALEAYYAAMRRRPSFRAAFVLESRRSLFWPGPIDGALKFTLGFGPAVISPSSRSTCSKRNAGVKLLPDLGRTP